MRLLKDKMFWKRRSNASNQTEPNVSVWSRRAERALRLLAADAETQLSVYPDFCVKADEIAFDVRDVVDVSWALEEAGAVPPALISALKDFDRRFEELSDGKHDFFWSEEGVRRDPEW